MQNSKISAPTQNPDDTTSNDNFLVNTMKARSKARYGVHALA